ncbi:hypothetical protein FRX31_026017 [Thalictrum thalictroides]|uniref:Uncharacterized protein n=1 Tax=Thalictrum thalictroides TaxID=46969 RepID=A0A7J6VH12_THATH|nr:hypothetical protein FRX31_026017 [Thalictrum thalictroides]
MAATRSQTSRHPNNNGHPSQVLPLEKHQYRNDEEERNPSQNSTTCRRERSKVREASVAASSQPQSNKEVSQGNKEEIAIRAEEIYKKMIIFALRTNV